MSQRATLKWSEGLILTVGSSGLAFTPDMQRADTSSTAVKQSSVVISEHYLTLTVTNYLFALCLFIFELEEQHFLFPISVFPACITLSLLLFISPSLLTLSLV